MTRLHSYTWRAENPPKTLLIAHPIPPLIVSMPPVMMILVMVPMIGGI